MRTVPSLRDATQMTVMRWFIYNGVKELHPEVQLSYAYRTKRVRIEFKLEKTHMVDARCISGNSSATPLTATYLYKQVRQNNRQSHKMTIAKDGHRKANKAERFVKGFQLFDKVNFEGTECFIFGRRKTGFFDLRTLDGTKIHRSTSYKKLRVTEKASTLLVEIQRRKEVRACSAHD